MQEIAPQETRKTKIPPNLFGGIYSVGSLRINDLGAQDDHPWGVGLDLGRSDADPSYDVS